LDPNHQIPQKRSVTLITIHADRINAQKSTKNCKEKCVPKVAHICEISGSFGCFLPGNKDSDPCLEDTDFLSPAKKGQRVGSLNPNPWIRNNTILVLLLLCLWDGDGRRTTDTHEERRSVTTCVVNYGDDDDDEEHFSQHQPQPQQGVAHSPTTKKVELNNRRHRSDPIQPASELESELRGPGVEFTSLN
jgi:hypothetical protein